MGGQESLAVHSHEKSKALMVLRQTAWAGEVLESVPALCSLNAVGAKLGSSFKAPLHSESNCGDSWHPHHFFWFGGGSELTIVTWDSALVSSAPAYLLFPANSIKLTFISHLNPAIKHKDIFVYDFLTFLLPAPVHSVHLSWGDRMSFQPHLY